MFESPLFWKIVALGGVILLLLIPLTIVRQIVTERSDYCDEVEDVIHQSTSRSQKIVGPLIVILVAELYVSLEDDKEIQRKHSYIRFWLPESLVVEGNQNVETRKIDIYESRVWHNDLSVRAGSNAEYLHDLNHLSVSIGKPFIAVGVGGARGVGVVQAPQVNGEPLAVESGTGLDEGARGIRIPLPDASRVEQNLNMVLSLNLSGTGDSSAVPVGRNSEITLTSNRPHPNFLGDFLPAKREISKSGLKAHWQSSWFANDLGERLDGEKTGWKGTPVFSVAVATPADQYQLTDRATKYAILPIVSTLMSFFVLEGMTNLHLHSVQYLLVGLSLVMFYLLLLALPEHIGSTAARITANLVDALMNGVYPQVMLQSWRNSTLSIMTLLGLDGMMQVLLRPQNSSLLLGTDALLVALRSVMFLAHHPDWYSLTQPKPKPTEILEPLPVQSDEFRLQK